MQRNILLTIAFHGAAFHGSAVQKNAATVQGALQPVLERILCEPLALKCCSRTDAGVHARMFCISFKTSSALACGRLHAALSGGALPDSISALGCREVPPGFHARYSCLGKQYEYIIHNSAVRNPFAMNLCVRRPEPIDAALLHAQAQDFVGTHDFSSFCASGGSVEDKVRTITSCAVRRDGAYVVLEVSGDGFLYHMVRIMVGTLLEIGNGRKPKGCIPGILDARDRRRAGFTAPPEGLYLARVHYALDGWDACESAYGKQADTCFLMRHNLQEGNT